MATYVDVHPDNPQPRLIEQVADAVRDDALIAYPTDSGYALGTRLGNRDGRDDGRGGAQQGNAAGHDGPAPARSQRHRAHRGLFIAAKATISSSHRHAALATPVPVPGMSSDQPRDRARPPGPG